MFVTKESQDIIKLIDTVLMHFSQLVSQFNSLYTHCTILNILIMYLLAEDGYIVHGLDTLIALCQKEGSSIFGPLNRPCKKDLPPVDTRCHGRCNLLHRATKEGISISFVYLSSCFSSRSSNIFKQGT